MNELSDSAPFVFSATMRAVEKHPERIAISCGGHTITYADLGARCAAAQKVLCDAAIQPGALVALQFQERPLLVPAILACIASGYPFVPLDVGMPVGRLRACCELVPIWGSLCDAELCAPTIFQNVLRMPRGELDGVPPWRNERGRGRWKGLGVDELANIYFTSGSTGKPKPIAGKLRGVDAFIQWEIDALGDVGDCRVTQLTSPAFDGSLKDIFVPLCRGGTICIPPDPELLLRPDDLVSWMAEERINVLHTVPSLLRQLLGAFERCTKVPDLKAIVLAGEPVRPGDVQRLMSAVGSGTRILNLYGPTETTLTKLFHVISPRDAERRVVPIGGPMPGTQVRLIDEIGKPCPPGVVGEIVIVTPYCSLGYPGQPQLTQSRFTADPGGSSDPAYWTGDLGRLNQDGELEFVGRIDNQVKIRGVRIEIEEVEAAFAGHPGVIEVAVVAREDLQGVLYLACYCVGIPGLTIDDLVRHGGNLLPRFMLPSVIRVVAELPHTRNGKIDRQRIMECEPQAVGVPSPTSRFTNTELMLTVLFREVLNCRDVDSGASFFVLGGNSLLAIQLLARVSKTFSVDLSVRQLFQNSSISELAREVDALKGAVDA